MIKMPHEDAVEGKQSVIRLLEWLSQAEDNDKMFADEVLKHLGQEIARATPEDVEIIMAWMYVGAIADRAMHKMHAQDIIENIIQTVMTHDDGAMEA
jgi:hypothetical protein